MFIETRLAAQPARTSESDAFWNAARDGKLMLGRCRACGEMHYYPRSICPHCFSNDTELKAASGRGRIYSFSIMRRAETPYVIAYVTLAEGPTMMTNIVKCDSDALAIGQPVRLLFQAAEGGEALAVFTPG
jgi:uncharacterized OB-fold protein